MGAQGQKSNRINKERLSGQQFCSMQIILTYFIYLFLLLSTLFYLKQIPAYEDLDKKYFFKSLLRQVFCLFFVCLFVLLVCVCVCFLPNCMNPGRSPFPLTWGDALLERFEDNWLSEHLLTLLVCPAARPRMLKSLSTSWSYCSSQSLTPIPLEMSAELGTGCVWLFNFLSA